MLSRLKKNETLVSAILIAAFVAMGAQELVHFFRGKPWPGYTLGVNYVSFFHLALWIAAIVSLALYGVKKPLFPLIGMFSCLVHGALIRVGRGNQGYSNIAVAVFMLVLFFGTRKFLMRKEAAERAETPRAA